MLKSAVSLLIIAVFSAICAAQTPEITEGTLRAVARNGAEIGVLPLKHTSVKADISGFLARVKVVQEFENDSPRPIEAIYTFPLPQNSAVDDLVMRVGGRTIRGRILTRSQARRVYEKAKNKGKTAALLDQERPNLFTQQVANILPKEKIIVEISYVETLKYEDGAYQFVFPMTVTPRYIPRSMKAAEAKKLTPPIVKERSGHDVSIEVNLDAGVPVRAVRSKSHEIAVASSAVASRATVALKNQNSIPNKDFVLLYDVSGERVADALLTHRDEKGGFFTLILQPPDRPAIEDVTPKEIVFVLDTSGSMSGFPIEKAKEAMRMSLAGLNPEDTFNLITFSGDTEILFENPVPATKANLERALEFLESRQGGGGTEMMKAIRASLAPSDSQSHVRVVCFMTDGAVGNDLEIIGEVQKHKQARVFSFGIGNSVNRFLLDKMAEEGRGEVEYVTLKDDGSAAARRFYERVRTPVLTDISIEWNGLPVADVYPNKIRDLFSAKPVIIYGRYTKGARGTIRLRGKMGGRDFAREIPVEFPEKRASHNVLATLWARTRIDEMMAKDWRGVEQRTLTPELEKEITRLGLDYRLLTQFTSFVAVEEKIVNKGGKQTSVEVPLELGEGLTEEFLEEDEEKAARSNYGYGRGSGNGSGRGQGDIANHPAGVNALILGPPSKSISGGVINGRAVNLIAPEYPPAARAARASGAVNVQVTIDENGDVISANAVSGHPLLRAAAERAVRLSKFSPASINGGKTKFSGVIVYNFGNLPNPANAAPNPLAVVPVIETTEMKRDRLIAEKFHVWLADLIGRLHKGNSEAAANEARFVKNGKAEIQIRLREKTPEILERLKRSGLEIAGETDAKTIVGRIAVEKLASLAEFEQIQYVLPRTR